MIKILLVLLFIAAVISLFSGLVFLVRDSSQSFRLINSLYLRVAFCVAILILLGWGFYTGELGNQAPWLQPR